MTTKNRARLLVSVAVLLGAATGLHACSGCREKGALAFVPHDALVAIAVPSLEDSLQGANALLERLRQGTLSGAMLASSRQTLIRELGFDPQQPETMRKKGIDPEAGLAMTVTQHGQMALAFGTKDRGTLDRYLRVQVTKLLRGAATFTTKQVNGVEVTLIGEEGTELVRGAWTFAKNHVVIASDRRGKPAELVLRLIKLERTIKDNDTFRTASDKVGRHDVLVYVDGNAARGAVRLQGEEALRTASDAMQKYIKDRQRSAASALEYFRGAALGARLADKQLALRGFYVAPADKAKVLQQIFSGAGEAPAFGKYIAPDALTVARLSLDLKKLFDRSLELLSPQRKRRIYQDIERLERENNVNLEKDVIALLGGRYAAAIYPPPAGAPTALPRSLGDASRLSSLVLMAQITNPAKAAELLTRLERFLVMRGLDIRARTEGERRTYTLERDGQPYASWTVTKRLLVIATGTRLASTLARIEKGGENVLDQLHNPAAKKHLKSDEGLLLNINLGKIADMVSALDLGMEAKLMLAPVIGTLSKFQDVTLWAEPDSEGVLGELAVTLK